MSMPEHGLLGGCLAPVIVKKKTVDVKFDAQYTLLK